MLTLKILYIDDNPEPALAKYLDKYQSQIAILNTQILDLIRKKGMKV